MAQPLQWEFLGPHQELVDEVGDGGAQDRLDPEIPPTPQPMLE
jgi:hypothetical protein